MRTGPDNPAQWMLEFATSGLSSLIGAGIGAWLAFTLENRREARRIRDSEVAALAWTQFILSSQYNTLNALWRQALEGLKDAKDRSLRLKPHDVHWELPRLDVNRISFVLTQDGGKLLSDLLVADERFQNVVGILRQRNVYHLKFQDQIDEGIQPGHALLMKLSDLTDSLFSLTNDTIVGIPGLFERVKAHTRSHYPGMMTLELRMATQ